jgi:hypothetical protein
MLKNGILKSIKDGRLPSASKVYLAENQAKNEARILVSVPRNERKVLLDFVFELGRRRAISKKSYVSIAIDPYVLLG